MLKSIFLTFSPLDFPFLASHFSLFSLTFPTSFILGFSRTDHLEQPPLLTNEKCIANGVWQSESIGHLENTHPALPTLGDENPVLLINGDISRDDEISRFEAVVAKLGQEIEFAIENHHGRF